MFLVIDNYDSFVYNLVHYLETLGETVKVYANDAVTIDFIHFLSPQGIIISPGPKHPQDAGLCSEIIHRFSREIPILGVCLGHQTLAWTYQGKVIKGKRPMHGKITPITHDGQGLFQNIPSPMKVTRYHSLIVEEATLPKDFVITARDLEGTIMGIRHKKLFLEGIQFHPEAVLTEEGMNLMKNYVSWCKEVRCESC